MKTGGIWRLTGWVTIGFSIPFLLVGIARFIPDLRTAAIGIIALLVFVLAMALLQEDFFVERLKTDLMNFRSVYIWLVLAFILGLVLGAL
ncbi:MAG TPA: hypothetical protein V6D10_20620 [Trichocoleus sp.]|jgi:uncharacterized membrane protein (GlpM family)